ncbi:TetR/AcrR family transcriptional regulator C-terminal domain-containing protein [Cohnella suwonensis]|uniref:TetR/AcrR family transcriptional regulator C-terminal domain-containing protein n=1 Tax=Cohnella suwonensis TaxID=696072 RepID=A0ABW0LX96_9BACL
MDHVTTRTDPRILRTRRLLKDAFVELLEEMDIEKISVNRIAERATINRVTFYLHYRDIPDMLEKMADDMVEDVKSILEEDMSDHRNSAEDLDWQMKKMVKLLEHIAEQSKFYKVVLATKRTSIFTERLLKLLTERITERVEQLGGKSLNRRGIQLDIAIWYGSSALIGTIVSWLRNDMPYTPDFLAKQFILLRERRCED